MPDNEVVIAIVDYGVGNLASVQKAFAAVGSEATLVRDPARLADATAIVLPGVGNFGHCSREFHRYGFAVPLRAARKRRVPILGICVGMQLLFEGSDEDTAEPGLGFYCGSVTRITGVPRVPQIGWNGIDLQGSHPWLRDVTDGDHFYFVHSYAPETDDDVVLGTVEYGGPRLAIVGSEGLLGVQFHPEKSGANGLRIIRAFAEAAAAAPAAGTAA
ncbi:MAG TPA: imidazole glycerol phosphate synthase subunit HisH [Candidatus Saccharimonadales bacterium]|nr:imidazole glycerol phosphate synthase subunit HisH [Candidatus Saccharimonadales bacterium]